MNPIEKVTIPDGMKVPKQTEEWLNAWKNSPIAKEWTEIQCQFLLDTALVHAAVWGMGRFDLVHELAAREREMGVNFEEKDTKAKDKATITLFSAIEKRQEKHAKVSNA